jgi:hypothetical protein
VPPESGFRRRGKSTDDCGLGRSKDAGVIRQEMRSKRGDCDIMEMVGMEDVGKA